MPVYQYQCRECEQVWDKYLSMDDRKIPETEPCPECGAVGSVYQMLGTPGFISDSKTPMRRAGQGWQDVLSKVKAASGRKNSIHD